MNRNLVDSKFGKVSVVQITGFVLMVLGILSMAISTIEPGATSEEAFWSFAIVPSATGIAISFFIIMLGFAFAFPSLLQGNEGLSTMRIVVFMVTNVICMLLLKFGWECKTLGDIGLDGYWMGVIAFVFGAKATQSYFENAKPFLEGAVKKNDGRPELTPEEFSKLALDQHKHELLGKFPNLVSVSDSVKEGEGVLVLYFANKVTNGVPTELDVKLPNGRTDTIKTELVTEVGSASTHFGQNGTGLNDPITKDNGSFCCLVRSMEDPTYRGIVTAGHVYSGGKFLNYNGFLPDDNKRPVAVEGREIAKWDFLQMKDQQDLAVAKIDLPGKNDLDQYRSFKTGYYTPGTDDVSTIKENVTILSNRGEFSGFLLDFNTSYPIYYDTKMEVMKNIILIGNNRDRTFSKSITQRGDSGGCVYHTDSGKLIGIVLGGDNRFTLVLPIDKTLSSFDFKPL